MLVLVCISKSLVMFGHCPMQVIFTDNVLAELERIFTDLLKDIVLVPKYNTMKPLHLPEDWSIVLLTSAHQVNMHMNIIMNHHNKAKPVITAFDL